MDSSIHSAVHRALSVLHWIRVYGNKIKLIVGVEGLDSKLNNYVVCYETNTIEVELKRRNKRSRS